MLPNTAVADAQKPRRMDGVMKRAVDTGPTTHLASRMLKEPCVDPSAPRAGRIEIPRLLGAAAVAVHPPYQIAEALLEPA